MQPLMSIDTPPAAMARDQWLAWPQDEKKAETTVNAAALCKSPRSLAVPRPMRSVFQSLLSATQGSACTRSRASLHWPRAPDSIQVEG